MPEQNTPAAVQVPYAVHVQRELQREMRALEENPLDRTRPGGEYIGADGQKHDANGEPLEGEAKQSSGDTFDVENATKDELKAEAERRGLTVKRGDGKEGEPLADDFRAALAG